MEPSALLHKAVTNRPPNQVLKRRGVVVFLEVALERRVMVEYLLVLYLCHADDCRWVRLGHFPSHEQCEQAASPRNSWFKCVMLARHRDGSERMASRSLQPGTRPAKDH